MNPPPRPFIGPQPPPSTNPFKDHTTPADPVTANQAAMVGRSRYPPIPAAVAGVPSIPEPKQPAESTHRLDIKTWRALGKARCAYLWDEIPAGFLTSHLGTGGKWMILLRATLDFIKYLQITNRLPKAPICLAQCDLGLLTGAESKDVGNEGRRQERIAMWALMDELPQGYGWGLIHELGGDAQDRVLYLAHRYIEEIVEMAKEDELKRAFELYQRNA